MTKRALIGPADWLRLRHELDLAEPDKERLLTLLGLRLDRPVVVNGPKAIIPDRRVIEPEPIRPESPASQDLAPPVHSIVSPDEVNRAWIEDIRPAPPPGIPTSLGEAAPMPAEPWHPPVTSALDPLFTRRLERTILIAALARERRTSELDVAELVRRAGRMDLHRRLPLLVRKTLRLGCQIIFDQSEVMELFFEDQMRLIAHVSAIVPEGRLTVVPSPFGAPDDDSWHLPDPGQPVLALSDLGTTRTFVPRPQRGPDAWLNVARRLGDLSSDLIVFFTGRLGAVPSDLRRLALIVPWDHRARTGSVDRRRRERLHR